MATSPSRSIAELRAWYRASAEALDRVRLEELAALSDEEALTRTRSLRLFVPRPRAPSDWSGLVEQQAMFHSIDPT
jgi:hypothetical protein